MYEAIWDDTNSENGCEPVADDVSEVADASFFGLERVNSKLAEWSWNRGRPKDKAKTFERLTPEIVVVVDESGKQRPRLDCVTEDDNDLIVAPPNSERPSAGSSCLASRPGSETASSSLSCTSTDDPEEGRKRKKDSLTVPGQEDSKRPGGQIGASSGKKRPSMTHRLSNLDETIRYFKNHRDSVLLAHQRLFKAAGVSPERFMHRDSVSIARKRIEEKHAAQAAAGDVPYEAHHGTPGRPRTPIADTTSSSSPPSGREKSDTTDSALTDPSKPAEGHRHIRISE